MTDTNFETLLYNGVATEHKQCPRARIHVRHLWQPVARAEHFTCFGNVPSSAVPATHSGSTDCPYCGNAYLVGRIEGHVAREHPGYPQPFEFDQSAVNLLNQVAESANDDQPLRPHPFVTRATHPDKSAENLKYCARLDCDRKWSDSIHDPSTFDADDLPTASELVRTGFHAWWVAMADEAAPTIQRKAAEYGSNSLAEMGRMFARAQGRDRIEDSEALEIGCMIYAKGKLERVVDSMLKGYLPSNDTWHDLAVYATMSQYIRSNGRWP